MHELTPASHVTRRELNKGYTLKTRVLRKQTRFIFRLARRDKWSRGDLISWPEKYARASNAILILARFIVRADVQNGAPFNDTPRNIGTKYGLHRGEDTASRIAISIARSRARHAASPEYNYLPTLLRPTLHSVTTGIQARAVAGGK